MFDWLNGVLILRSLFVLLSILGVAAALGTVLARNLVRAALCLVGFFFVIACQFVLLDAEFLAAVQVLVYVGAVVVLLLFGIMLTRNIQGDETTGGPWYTKVPGAVLAAGVFVVLWAGISGQGGASGGLQRWTDIDERPQFLPNHPTSDPRARVVQKGMAEVVGAEMMTRYVVAFEVAGLLLTAAVVGAVALAHGDDEDEQPARLRAASASRAEVGSHGAAVPTEPRSGAASTLR